MAGGMQERRQQRSGRNLGGGRGWSWFSRERVLHGAADRRRRVREWKQTYETERDGGARERARYEEILQQLVEEVRGVDGKKGKERKKGREMIEGEKCDVEARKSSGTEDAKMFGTRRGDLYSSNFRCAVGIVEETGWRRCMRERVIDTVLERRSVVRDWRKKYKGKQKMDSEAVGVGVSEEDRIVEGGDETMLVWRKQINNVDALKQQVLQIPQYIIKTGCFRGQTCIELYDSDIDVTHMCELHTSKRKYTVEQFLGKGWYAYARQKELTKGDIIEFRIQNAVAPRIVVHLVKFGNAVGGS